LQKIVKTMSWLATHQLVLLAIAGMAGTLARYWLSGAVQRLCGASFPWGTLAVNILGCLLFGFVWTLAEEWQVITEESRLVILTGFMGAFTTFSTFAFDTAEFLNSTIPTGGGRSGTLPSRTWWESAPFFSVSPSGGRCSRGTASSAALPLIPPG
jgi:fluoride exporter